MIARDAHSMAHGIAARMKEKYGQLKEGTPLFDVVYNVCEEIVSVVNELNCDYESRQYREKIERVDGKVSAAWTDIEYLKNNPGLIEDEHYQPSNPPHGRSVLFMENSILKVKCSDGAVTEFGRGEKYPSASEIADVLWTKMQAKAESDNAEFINELRALKL